MRLRTCTAFARLLPDCSPGSGEMSEITIEPSATVYVRDLNDKARKSEMKQALYILFSNYGPILELILLKTQKLRGQAFVVFANLSSATNAIEGLQKFTLFGKNMVCLSD